MSENVANLDLLCKKISEKVKKGEQLYDMKDILSEYNGTDWEDYCSFCSDSYKRNHVYGDDVIDVYIICWNIEQASGVHDHPNNGCLLRVMRGILREDVYTKTNDHVKRIKTNQMGTDDISYKIGRSGLHNIINEGQQAASLHIYSPPKHALKFYPEVCDT